MLLQTLISGPLQVNTYLLGCEQSAVGAVIDPGGRVEDIERFLRRNKLRLQYIINTHAHPDHVLANWPLKRSHPRARLLIHQAEAKMLTNPDPLLCSMIAGDYVPQAADVLLRDGDEIRLGEIKLRVLHTPGHTQGGICLLGEGVLFSGDTLFAGGVGRTDFPGGSYQALLASIKKKLFALDPALKVLPGHGPASTIEDEMKYNPFLTETGGVPFG